MKRVEIQIAGTRLMLVRVELRENSILFICDREIIAFKPTAYALTQPLPGKKPWDKYAMNVRANLKEVFSHIGPEGKNILSLSRTHRSSGYTLLKEVELLLKGLHRYKGISFQSIKGTIETRLHLTEGTTTHTRLNPNGQNSKSVLVTRAGMIMQEHHITRPQAVKIGLAMVELGATSEECAQPERTIMKQAGVKSRIVSVFTDRSGDAKNYTEFRKLFIKNTGTRKGLYYLKLSS